MKSYKIYYGALLIFTLFLLNACLNKKDSSCIIYVSASGNDINKGTSQSSPILSLSKAFKIMSEESSAGKKIDFQIILEKGHYFVDSALILNADKSQNVNSLVIKSAENSNSIICGGRKIEYPWKQLSDSLWAVKIPENININQLFRDGKRLVRSRWPNTYIFSDSVNVKERFLIVKNDFPEISNVTGIELHVTGMWHFIRQMVESVKRIKDKTIVKTKTEIGPECSSTKVKKTDRLFFENSFAFVDSEGEWFFDEKSSTFYLQTKRNPNLSTFYYPIRDELIRINGSKDKRLKNIEFLGLTFEYTTWQMGHDERKGIQAGIWGTHKEKPVYAPPAALTLRYVTNAMISDCKFACLGEGAVAIEAGCNDIKIERNQFYDIGSNVIQIGRQSGYIGKGHPLHLDYRDNSDAPTNCLIADNTITNCGVTDLGSVGIWLGYTNHNSVTYNTVTDLPYSGITLGWRWDTLVSNTHHNQVTWNYVARCMQYANDGGGIYTSGNQPKTLIGNNLVRDIMGCESWAHGIYNDEGSANIEVSNNIVVNSLNHDYFFHRNLWGTMNVNSNNGTNGKNKLTVQNEYLRYLDFNNNPKYDISHYGSHIK